jgi:hypothetical protein
LLKEAERDSRKFLASYGNFENIDNNLIPTEIEFRIETDDQKIRIGIEYSKVQINQELTYPFRIPDTYTEVKSLKPEKE